MLRLLSVHLQPHLQILLHCPLTLKSASSDVSVILCHVLWCCLAIVLHPLSSVSVTSSCVRCFCTCRLICFRCIPLLQLTSAVSKICCKCCCRHAGHCDRRTHNHRCHFFQSITSDLPFPSSSLFIHHCVSVF